MWRICVIVRCLYHWYDGIQMVCKAKTLNTWLMCDIQMETMHFNHVYSPENTRRQNPVATTIINVICCEIFQQKSLLQMT